MVATCKEYATEHSRHSLTERSYSGNSNRISLLLMLDKPTIRPVRFVSLLLLLCDDCSHHTQYSHHQDLHLQVPAGYCGFVAR